MRGELVFQCGAFGCLERVCGFFWLSGHQSRTRDAQVKAFRLGMLIWGPNTVKEMASEKGLSFPHGFSTWHQSFPAFTQQNFPIYVLHGERSTVLWPRDDCLVTYNQSRHTEWLHLHRSHHKALTWKPAGVQAGGSWPYCW